MIETYDNHGRAPHAGEVRLSYYRRSRAIGIQVGKGGGLVSEAKLSLPDLLQSTGITHAEIQAALEEAQAPQVVAHQDGEASPDFVRMRVDALPADCTGKSVLDIGGYDGEIAAECLARGAASAVVFDNGEWTDYSWAKPIVKPGCVYQRGDLMNFGAEAPQPADIVLLYNVIYHVRDVWTAIERCRLLTKETFVICTSFIEGDIEGWKLLGRNENDMKINGHHSVFWKPTLNGLRRLLELNGFVIDEQVGPVGDHVCIRCH